jgi:hypothetical protein
VHAHGVDPEYWVNERWITMKLFSSLVRVLLKVTNLMTILWNYRLCQGLPLIEFHSFRFGSIWQRLTCMNEKAHWIGIKQFLIK